MHDLHAVRRSLRRRVAPQAAKCHGASLQKDVGEDAHQAGGGEPDRGAADAVAGCWPTPSRRGATASVLALSPLLPRHDPW